MAAKQALRPVLGLPAIADKRVVGGVGFGMLSDRFGRKPVLLGATVAGFLGAVPLFWLMHHPDVGSVLLGQMEDIGIAADTSVLDGLPPGILLYGTRDLLAPGCRLLARRATEAGWDLTAIEEPDLIHVYGLLPVIPEAARAFRQVRAFVR